MNLINEINHPESYAIFNKTDNCILNHNGVKQTFRTFNCANNTLKKLNLFYRHYKELYIKQIRNKRVIKWEKDL